MFHPLPLAILTAGALFLTGCGAATPCDELDELKAECGVVVPESDEELQCADDSAQACQAECGLDADCDFFDPEDPNSQEHIDRVTAYGACFSACTGT